MSVCDVMCVSLPPPPSKCHYMKVPCSLRGRRERASIVTKGRGKTFWGIKKWRRRSFHPSLFLEYLEYQGERKKHHLFSKNCLPVETRCTRNIPLQEKLFVVSSLSFSRFPCQLPEFVALRATILSLSGSSYNSPLKKTSLLKITNTTKKSSQVKKERHGRVSCQRRTRRRVSSSFFYLCVNRQCTHR